MWLGRTVGMFRIQIKTNIRAKCESLLHIINKLIPHGERQVASGVGRNCCFWRAACFRSEVRSWNGRRVQYFLIKAQQYPMILSRGKQDCWLTPSFLSEREREHTVFSEDITSQLPSLLACRSTPNHLSSTRCESGSLPNPWKSCVSCACYTSTEFKIIP